MQTLLADHDVFITDWRNARDVRVDDGRFGIDEYVDHVIAWLEAIGPGGHALAVCQPCAPALVAAAIMAEDRDPASPRSLTLMAGPIDTRVNPTASTSWRRPGRSDDSSATSSRRSPLRYTGAFRRVYPASSSSGRS